METGAQRTLDPAERYFALLDQLVPMNVLVTATFAESISVAAVEAAWARLSASATALRSRIDFTDPGSPRVEETSEQASHSLTVCDLEMQTAMQIEQDTPFDHRHGSLARCRIGKPKDGPDYMLLTLSHALIDGRGGLGVLRALIREVESPGSVKSVQTLPEGLHRRTPTARLWSHRRLEMIELLRVLSHERAGQAPDECTWHSRSHGMREILLRSLRLSAAQTSALVSVARSSGTSFYGILGAACLQEANAAFNDGQSRALTLMTAVDLRRHFAVARDEDAIGMYASMLSAAYHVSPGTIGDLSRRISENLRTQLDRGEGELFYALSRCERVPLSPGDGQWASRSLGAAGPSVAVSNVGVIDDSGDPEWVTSLSATLAPTSNQVAFIAATTYRDSVTINVSIDARSMSELHATDFGNLKVLHSLIA